MKKETNNSKKLLMNGIIHVKNELKPSHLKDLKEVVKTKSDVLPILLIENLINGSDYKLILSIYTYLEENNINVGCIISGENHFSAILLLSSANFKYRSASFDSEFVFDPDDYSNKNSKPKDTHFSNNLSSFFKSGNPFNAETIMAVFNEGDELCVYDAYRFGLIDNIMPVSNEDISNEKEIYDIIEMVRFDADLYIDRMNNIKEYFFNAIDKLF